MPIEQLLTRSLWERRHFPLPLPVPENRPLLGRRRATENMASPSYPLEFFQRVITVSLETMKTVNWLPPIGDLSD